MCCEAAGNIFVGFVSCNRGKMKIKCQHVATTVARKMDAADTIFSLITRSSGNQQGNLVAFTLIAD